MSMVEGLLPKISENSAPVAPILVAAEVQEAVAIDPTPSPTPAPTPASILRKSLYVALVTLQSRVAKEAEGSTGVMSGLCYKHMLLPIYLQICSSRLRPTLAGVPFVSSLGTFRRCGGTSRHSFFPGRDVLSVATWEVLVAVQIVGKPVPDANPAIPLMWMQNVRMLPCGSGVGPRGSETTTVRTPFFRPFTVRWLRTRLRTVTLLGQRYPYLRRSYSMREEVKVYTTPYSRLRHVTGGMLCSRTRPSLHPSSSAVTATACQLAGGQRILRCASVSASKPARRLWLGRDSSSGNAIPQSTVCHASTRVSKWMRSAPAPLTAPARTPSTSSIFNVAFHSLDLLGDSMEVKTSEQPNMLLMSKLWYGLVSSSSVFLLPYIPMWLGSLGVSDGQIGLAMAMRPWFSALTMLAVPAVADHNSNHRMIVSTSFIASTILRCGTFFLAANGSSVVIVIGSLILAEMIAAPVAPIVDSLVVAACKEEGSTYGEQRLWGSVGWGLLSIPTGMLIQGFGCQACFIGYAALAVPCIPVALMLNYPNSMKIEQTMHLLGPREDLESAMTEAIQEPIANGQRAVALAYKAAGYKGPLTRRFIAAMSSSSHLATADPGALARSISSTDPRTAGKVDLDVKLVDVKLELDMGMEMEGGDSTSETEYKGGLAGLLKSPDMWLFLWQTFMMGAAGTGLIGTYVFLYVKYMGTETSFLGIILLVNCMAEALFFKNQEAIMTRFTPEQLINVSQGALVVRLLAYAYAPIPWMVLGAESIQGLSFAGGWVASCVKAKELSPPGMEATVQGLMTAMFLGVGAGAGALLGGTLLDADVCWRDMWLICAGVMTVGWGVSLAGAKYVEIWKAQEVKKEA
eukprot:gene16586-22822_t